MPLKYIDFDISKSVYFEGTVEEQHTKPGRNPNSTSSKDGMLSGVFGCMVPSPLIATL